MTTLNKLAEETPEQREERYKREQYAWDLTKRDIATKAAIIQTLCEFEPKKEFDKQFAKPYFQIRSIRNSIRQMQLALRTNELAKIGIASPMVTREEVISEYDHKFDSTVMGSLIYDLGELISRSEMALGEADISRKEQKEFYQWFKPLKNILNKLSVKGLEMWKQEQAKAELERTQESPFKD